MALALKKVKGSLDRIFDKNLQDLVRGIRNHKESESHYISTCIEEIKNELRQDNFAIKANAVNKLLYLQMLGYDISWAAFNIIEVMSATKFTFKRIGYSAAAQSFHAKTDVLMLTTNMIRKDLGSQTLYDAGVALNGLSCFMTPDLARDLVNDILSLMSSTRPYIRKRAVLISYKIFLAYPDALRPAFPRLKEKLEDPDPGVQSAAVNVICELARKNPKNYLSLAPIFFKLMTTSTNNWVLIKIIKLFGALTPLEPRLGKKLIEPLTNLIHSTSAMSLLYECINTVIQGMTDHSSSIQITSPVGQLCVQKLRILIEDADQNLKYLGLLAMSRILKSHPKAVQAHKDLILRCLDDKDESIRLRALDLLFGMVSKKNLMEIVKKLMQHVSKAEGSQYRDELLSKIIEICCQQNYLYITNFEWYVTVLVELTRTEGATRHGSLISSQILDVAIRVKSIRAFAAKQMAVLLQNSHAIASQLQRNGMQEVLYAAAYVCGEFSQFIEDPSSLVQVMLHARVSNLPPHIQSIFIQNAMKLFARASSQAEEDEDSEKVDELLNVLMEKLPVFVQSGNLEVQERASCVFHMVKYASKAHGRGAKIAPEFTLLFKGELNPVAPKAQKKVPVPEGLDLDAWINEPPESSEDEASSTFTYKSQEVDGMAEFYTKKEKQKELSPEERKELREQRLREQESNPNYLSSKPKAKKIANGYQVPGENGDDLPPVADIDISIPLHVPGMSSSDKYLRQEQERRRKRHDERMKRKAEKEKKKGKKGRKSRKKHQVEDSPDDDIEPVHAVDIMDEEMPEGAVKTDSEEDEQKDDLYKALDIDLDSPLTVADKLPTRSHRIVKESAPKAELKTAESEEPVEKKKKKKKEKKKKEKKRHHHRDNLLLVEEREEDSADGNIGDSSTAPKEDTLNGHQTPVKDPPKQPDQSDDLDFWLSTTSEKQEAEKPTEALNGKGDAPPVQDAVESTKHRHKKKKKHHEKEKSSKHKKHRKKDAEVVETVEAVEELDKTPGTPPLQLSTRFVPLAENEHLSVKYETRVIPMQEKQILVAFVFTNQAAQHLKDIEFNVLDTLNTRLIRPPGSSSHDAVKIPFSLLPSSLNEAHLVFSAVSLNMPQKLRGTITYILKDNDSATQHKLDFKLCLPCNSYLVATPCSSDHFANLLSSGEVSEKSSIRVNAPDLKFSHALQKICFYLKFSVVERVDDSASLYATSIQQHHVCLLLKAVPNGLSVDGKSNESSLLSNILDELKELLK